MSAIIAHRYASAFYQEAKAANAIPDADADMKALGQSFADSAELRQFFASPVINRDQKEKIIKKIFSGKVGDLTLKLLLLLIRKGRGGVAESVASAYTGIRDEVEGRVEATAKSAIDLSAEEKSSLESVLQNLTGKKIRLNTEIDTSLIGGVVVRVGDTVYDGSVKHQLAVLRERMGKSIYLSN